MRDSQTASRHPVHPVVTLDYRVRIPGMFFVALFALSYFAGRPRGPILIAAIVLTGLVWPHAADFLAKRARDTKQAELRNLLADSFIVGCWIAAMTRLTPTGPAVGMMPDMEFRVGQARLEAAEGLLAFTDGVTDARGASSRYGEERLLALLSQPHNSASSLLDAIQASVAAHVAGQEQADDITLLAVRRQLP